MGGQSTGIRNPGDGPGQPSKLTPGRLAKVVNALECGLSVKVACRVADIDQSTHENYLARGEKDAAQGKASLYAEYFRLVPVGMEKGAYARRSLAWDIIKNPESKPEALARARVAMQFDAMVEGGRLAQARRRALRKGLTEHGQPTTQQPPQAEERAAPVEFSRLSAPDFARYQHLAAKARTAFTTLSPGEVLELQSLLRKAQGAEELTPPTSGAETGTATPDGAPPESSRAPSGDAPPVAP